MLTPLAENLWDYNAPLSVLGMALGHRMTVARLRDGSLWLHSRVIRRMAREIARSRPAPGGRARSCRVIGSPSGGKPGRGGASRRRGGPSIRRAWTKGEESHSFGGVFLQKIGQAAELLRLLEVPLVFPQVREEREIENPDV